MSKYYVQCGSFQFLTTAADPRGAALWAIHHFLGNRVALAEINWSAAETIDQPELIGALLELEDEILVSEMGFGHRDAAILECADILAEWNQMLIALERLAEGFPR